MGEFTAAILRNKGVPVDVVTLKAIEEDDATVTHQRTLDKDGNFVTEQRYVRFDANALADLEDTFGSIDQFELVLRTKAFKGVRDALALVWDVPPRRAGLMMIDGNIADYATAVGTALALANGVDPTQAVRLYKVGMSTGQRLMDARNKQLAVEIDKAEAEAETQNEQPESLPETLTVEPDASEPRISGEPNKGSPPSTMTTVAIPTPAVATESSPGTTGSPVGSPELNVLSPSSGG